MERKEQSERTKEMKWQTHKEKDKLVKTKYEEQKKKPKVK
jgi:hypothetical protein